MPIPISDVIGTTHAALTAQGAFDAFVDVDSKLYIDPHLLASSTVPELCESYKVLQTHFERVITLIRHIKAPHDPFAKTATKLLTFSEIGQTGLGYSKGNTQGTGIGPRLAAGMVELATVIVQAGIADPAIFELMGVLQDGIGADRISDMTAMIILPDLCRYNQRVAQTLNIKTSDYTVGRETYKVPVNSKSGLPVILVPCEILRDLPVAESWDEIDEVASHNAALRERANALIGSTWQQATRRLRKIELREALLQHPELIADLVQQYKRKPRSGYDFRKDPAGKQIWYYLTREVLEEAGDVPVQATPVTDNNVIEVVREICLRFKHLVEHNRLYQVLRNDDGTPRSEKIAQLTFSVVADAYCNAGGLDLTPEANAGMGPVDFKMSAGYTSRVLVEMKRSSHKRLVHGYQAQLPIYEAAEKSQYSFFVIVRDDDNLTRIHEVQALSDAAVKAGRRAPEIIIVDARPRDSASK